jgi:membrane-associated protease RseP (regulator of RpoE activity)
MQDPQVSNAITDSVQKAIQEKLQTALPDVVKGAVLGAQQATDQKAHDPYRTTIHFLAGLIAFCLAVIVGIFNAFPDPPIDTGSVVYRMFGGVLACISITALVATVSALIAQLRKYRYRVKQKRGQPRSSLETGVGPPHGRLHPVWRNSRRLLRPRWSSNPERRRRTHRHAEGNLHAREYLRQEPIGRNGWRAYALVNQRIRQA